MPGAFRRQDLGNLARTRFNGFLLPKAPCLKPKLKNQKKRDRSTRGLMRRSVSGSYRPGSLIFGSFRAAWVPTAFGDYAFAPFGRCFGPMLVVARFGFGPSKAGGQFVRMYFNTSLRR